MTWEDVLKRNPRDSKKVRDAQQRKIDRESEREFIPKKPKPSKSKPPEEKPPERLPKEEVARRRALNPPSTFTPRMRRRRDVPFNPFKDFPKAEENRRKAEEKKRKEQEG
jgi:hypothetical protein